MPSNNVLVVDDEPAVRRLLDLKLRQCGLGVWVAASGKEAVEIYGKHEAEIGVVLLDVRLGEMNGPETLAELRRLNPDVPCCFMTGFSAGYTYDQLLALGATHVFSKPFDMNELTHTLCEMAEREQTT